MSVISETLIRDLFTSSLRTFLQREALEIIEGVNERNNCARWAIYLEQEAHDRGLIEYITDTEYNRKQDGQIKTILDGNRRIVTINCDLILHTRGANISEDNLIAIEVKKYDRSREDKQRDRERLRALTKESYDDVWMNDGSTPPEHVCGYRLGVFVELDRNRRICRVEYYKDGKYDSVSEYTI